MSEYFAFSCGCKFKVLNKDCDPPLIDFNPELESINLNCEKTWDLISSGNTKGCFQEAKTLKY